MHQLTDKPWENHNQINNLPGRGAGRVTDSGYFLIAVTITVSLLAHRYGQSINRRLAQRSEDELTDIYPSDREKWVFEKRLREQELLIKERDATTREIEISLKQAEFRSGRWRSPLIVAILAATIAGIGNAVVVYTSAKSQRLLEADKSEQARILEVIKTGGDPDRAAENMKFLLEAGLINDVALKTELAKYLKDRKPGNGAALPTSAGIFQSAPVIIADSLFFGLNQFELSTESTARLDRLIRKLAGMNLEIIVVVFVKNAKETSDDIWLRRFDVIKSYLVSRGVEKNRVYPESTNESALSGVAQLSRVDFEIVGTSTQKSAPPSR